MSDKIRQIVIIDNKILEHNIFKEISKIANKNNIKVFVIGGFVRDLLLNRNSKDIDILVIGSGIEFAKKLAENLDIKNVSYFKNFGTAMLVYQDIEIEFVGARKESYDRNSRNPIVENGTLDDDLNRRDFTINAMGISLNSENFGELIDKFDGQKDLKNKLIKTPLNPEITFSDDPLRMLRAIRFSTQLNFYLSDEIIEAIIKNKKRLSIISEERITDELNKILLSPKPSKGLKLLEKTGLLQEILPELSKMKGVEIIDNLGHKDNFYHSIEVVDNLAEKTNNIWLLWAGLLHDIGKPKTKRFQKKHGWTFHGHEVVGARMAKVIFERLKMPLHDKMKYVQKLIALHLRPIALVNEVSDSAIRRLLFDAGDDIDDLMLLAEADITSKNDFKVKKFLNNFKIVREKLIEIEEKDKLRNWQPPVSGDDIMQLLNMKPSKEIGIIKNAIREAILDGKIENNREAALEFMYKKAKTIKD